MTLVAETRPSAGVASRTGSALSPLFGPDEDTYRDRVRSVVASFTPETRRGWVANGHLDRDALQPLGAGGLFHDRWADGATSGLGYAMVMAQEVGRVSSGLGLAAMTQSEVFIGALSRLVSTPWQRALLAEALAGSAVGCFAATEPGAGSDVFGIETVARRSASGWRIVGRKRYVSNAGAATHVLVVAGDGGAADGLRRISLFAVPLDTPGVRVRGFFAKAGLHDCDTAELDFDCEVGEDSLLGGAGNAMVTLQQCLQLERLSVSCQVLTAARSSLGLAAAFARRRRVFGERLIDKQAVRHKLSDSLTRLWAAESLLLSSIAAARSLQTIGHRTAATKLFATNVAGEVIDGALQVLGGRGYTANYPVEGFWRDARVARIGGGSDEVLREVLGTTFERPDREFDHWLDELEAADSPVLTDGTL